MEKDPTHVLELRDLGACRQGLEYAATKPDMAAVWRDCERADWMLWLAERTAGQPGSQPRKRLVGCAAECAATAIRFVRDDDLSAKLTEAARLLKRYAESTGTECDEDLKDALDLVGAHAGHAAADAAAGAAHVASSVYAPFAADAAIDASYAADAGLDAHADAARKSALRSMADIVRRHYSEAPTKRWAE
jgi:hypothetical protein